MPQASTSGEHVIEAVVAGPDGANRLHSIVGSANVGTFVNNGQNKTETWTFLVGPVLTRRQFHRAIAHVAVVGMSQNVQTPPMNSNFQINSVEADWDDESGRVEVRAEIFASVNGGSIGVNQLRYSVTTLAEV